jgi:hypothetical protein
MSAVGPNDGIRPGRNFVQASGLKTRGGQANLLVRKSKEDRRLPVLHWLIALLTDTELVDDRAVPLHVDLLEIVQQAAAATDELQKTAAAVMILRVRLEVLGKIGNAVREECDLHFWRSGIAVMDAILVDEVRLLFLGRRQNPVSLLIETG